MAVFLLSYTSRIWSSHFSFTDYRFTNMNISYDINTEFILNFCFNNEQACSTTAALFWHFWEAHLLLKWKNIGKQEIYQRCSLWYNKSIHFWVFCWNTRPLNKPNWHEKEKTELQRKRSFSSKSLVKMRGNFYMTVVAGNGKSLSIPTDCNSLHLGGTSYLGSCHAIFFSVYVNISTLHISKFPYRCQTQLSLYCRKLPIHFSLYICWYSYTSHFYTLHRWKKLHGTY